MMLLILLTVPITFTMGITSTTVIANDVDPNDIEIDTASISGIRWLWGPEVFTLKTW